MLIEKEWQIFVANVIPNVPEDVRNQFKNYFFAGVNTLMVLLVELGKESKISGEEISEFMRSIELELLEHLKGTIQESINSDETVN